jgi:hypothetical protein
MRNYRKEYDNYHSRKEQRERRSSRNKARRKVVKANGKASVKGKDVDHKDRNPMNNSPKNLRVTYKAKNRSNNK